MRVLITGGYGFIGSHVADKFYSEGYEVHILDNLSTGTKEFIHFKHKSYILAVDDPKCKEIFTTYRFDIVIHLAAQVSERQSISHPINDAQQNIVGLLNILTLANEHHVKKFIFASADAVYGKNKNLPISEQQKPMPITPYGLSKWAGEQYCMHWHEVGKLEILCLRLSNVYGPRQSANESVIASFCSKALDGERLQVYGDGMQTRDYIYVTDVASAIFRAAESHLSGIYNVSTNKESSVLSIIEHFQKIDKTIEYVYTNRYHSDIDRMVLDNTAIKRELDWVPLYSLEEGIQKLYTLEKNRRETRLTEQVKEKKKDTLLLV